MWKIINIYNTCALPALPAQHLRVKFWLSTSLSVLAAISDWKTRFVIFCVSLRKSNLSFPGNENSNWCVTDITRTDITIIWLIYWRFRGEDWSHAWCLVIRWWVCRPGKVLITTQIACRFFLPNHNIQIIIQAGWGEHWINKREATAIPTNVPPHPS